MTMTTDRRHLRQAVALIAAILATMTAQPTLAQANGWAADGWASILTPEADAKIAGCQPSPRQLAYQEKQLGAFAHFGLPTYATNDAEYQAVFPFKPGSVPAPSRFNPERARRRAMGVWPQNRSGPNTLCSPPSITMAFCLWPTKTTDYSVRNTPWRNGKRRSSCAKWPWPARNTTCRWASTARPPTNTKAVSPIRRATFALVGDREAYFKLYQEQLRELLTNYGEMVMVWFDNYCDPFCRETTDPATGQSDRPRQDTTRRSCHLCVRSSRAPSCLRYRSELSDLRAVGNEDGTSPYPIWNVMHKGEGPKHRRTARARGRRLVSYVRATSRRVRLVDLAAEHGRQAPQRRATGQGVHRFDRAQCEHSHQPDARHPRA